MATLTATEMKLVWLALDRAATATEAEVAATKLINSLRARGVTGQEFCELPSAKRRRPDVGDTVIPFGKYRGKPIREIPGWYLDWVIREVKNQQDLINAIQRFLDTEVTHGS